MQRQNILTLKPESERNAVIGKKIKNIIEAIKSAEDDLKKIEVHNNADKHTIDIWTKSIQSFHISNLSQLSQASKYKLHLNPFLFNKYGYFTDSIIRKHLASFDFDISCLSGSNCNIYSSQVDGIFIEKHTILQIIELFGAQYDCYQKTKSGYEKKKKT